MELWDAYDENFRLVPGVVLVRGEKPRAGLYHVVVDILVRHRDGTYLLMRRDPRKVLGGLWEASAGGSALRGETPLEAARRELREETGIEAGSLTELGRLSNHDAFFFEFLCETDCPKDAITLQEGETVDFRWVTAEALSSMSRGDLATHRVQPFVAELRTGAAPAPSAENPVPLLYATGNPAKRRSMAWRLRDWPIRLITPAELNLHFTPEENGETAVENALQKAQIYYDMLRMPTIAGDSGMLLEGVDAAEQPGLHVRREGGRTLSDGEMIARYTALAERAPGPVYLQYYTGVALITERGSFTAEIPDVRLRLVSEPCLEGARPGFSLDSVSVTEDGRYYCALSDEERTLYNAPFERAFTDFILSHLALKA